MDNCFKFFWLSLLSLLRNKEGGNGETKGNCSWRGCCCFYKMGKTSLNAERQVYLNSKEERKTQEILTK